MDEKKKKFRRFVNLNTPLGSPFPSSKPELSQAEKAQLWDQSYDYYIHEFKPQLEARFKAFLMAHEGLTLPPDSEFPDLIAYLKSLPVSQFYAALSEECFNLESAFGDADLLVETVNTTNLPSCLPAVCKRLLRKYEIIQADDTFEGLQGDTAGLHDEMQMIVLAFNVQDQIAQGVKLAEACRSAASNTEHGIKPDALRKYCALDDEAKDLPVIVRIYELLIEEANALTTPESTKDFDKALQEVLDRFEIAGKDLLLLYHQQLG